MSEVGREVTRKMREEAKQKDALVSKLTLSERQSPMERGWVVREMKEKNMFALLGFDTEGDYRKSKKIGRSTWFRYVGLAEKLKKLPKAEFLKLIPENADHLARFEENIRYRKDLIAKAQTATEEEMEKALVRHRAGEEGKTEDDVIVSLKLRFPEGARKVVLRVFKKFAEQHGIDADDYGRICELICAEIEHRNPVVTAMMRVTHQMGEVIKILTDGGNLSADEVIKKSLGLLAPAFRDMCQAAGVKKPEQLLGDELAKPQLVKAPEGKNKKEEKPEAAAAAAGGASDGAKPRVH